MRDMWPRRVGWVVACLGARLLSSCSESSPMPPGGAAAGTASSGGSSVDAYGGEREPCFPNDTCEPGLSCVAEECVRLPNTMQGAGGTADAAAGDRAFGGEPGSDAGGVGGAGGSDDGAGASRPMPNPVSAGLPNPAMYDSSKPGVVLDRLTRLMWQRDAGSDTYVIADVATVCSSTTLGGYDDWRVPSRLELSTLVDFTTSAPAIDSEVFPLTGAGSYWSSTPYADEPQTEKWVVHFEFGGTFRGWSATQAAVRCVRGEPFAARYEAGTDTLAGTVIDHTTGLLWKQTSYECGPYQAGATEHCESLDLAGFQDWRVPSMNELQLIVDDSRYDPSMDTTLFPPALEAPENTVDTMGLWSSSISLKHGVTGWSLRRRSGLLESGGGTAVRCVR